MHSWYKYEGLRMTKGQALLQWVADNPNLQASSSWTASGCDFALAGKLAPHCRHAGVPSQAATLMAGVSRPAALPFATRVHEGRSDRMAVWDPRDAAALRLLLSQFDVVGELRCALCSSAAGLY